MGELIVTILIFIAVIAITALLFGGWLIVMIVGAVARVLLRPFRRSRHGDGSLLIDAGATSPRCANERCRAAHPPEAMYCRRCGAPMRAAQHVPVRRVAMW